MRRYGSSNQSDPN